ncbi:VanZ family protein [Leptolyngbya sp. 7M]|uniref:VanZ family protein n=1 Tax=Leptolyngbya sp. 7M TaxID=2812896 RepID=UPI003977DD92
MWIGVIFYLSSQAGAASETSRFLGPLIQYFFPEMLPESRQMIHAIIRKSAHFFEYAVLAALVIRAFSLSSLSKLRKNRFVLAIIFSGIIASIDEFNQSLNPARTGLVTDVLLDLSGAIFATLLVYSFYRFRYPYANHHDPMPGHSPPRSTLE